MENCTRFFLYTLKRGKNFCIYKQKESIYYYDQVDLADAASERNSSMPVLIDSLKIRAWV